MSFDRLRVQIDKKYPGVLVNEDQIVKVNVIPTGSLALDYALGTGGWPRGTYVGIYGQRNIGKSVLALNACANALSMGLKVAYISVEGWHKADWEWARQLGVDTSSVDWIVAEPKYGEEAFELLGEFVEGGADLVVVDSLGALISKSESGMEGTKRVGGQSGLITDGVKRWNIRIKQNNVCVLMLNQVRAVMSSSFALDQQPGGNALEHLERLIVELKNKERFMHPVDKNTIIGRSVVAIVQRTKFNEGDGHRATYNFYSARVDDKPFGIDKVADVVNTGKRVGAIKGSNWLTLPDGSRHNGAEKVGEYVFSNPHVYEQIREMVLEQMVAKGGKLELRVV